MYPVMAKWTILTGKENEAIAALHNLAKEVEKTEPDTLLYMVHVPNFKAKSLPTPPIGEVVFWEVYSDVNAFNKHITGPAFQNFLKTYGNLFLTDFGNPPQVYMTTETLIQLGGFARANINH